MKGEPSPVCTCEPFELRYLGPWSGMFGCPRFFEKPLGKHHRIRHCSRESIENMLEEFKKFALKGNLIDMAVAFVMGAAFTKLSTAFIDDMIMPLIGLVTPGDLDFSDKYIVLKGAVEQGTALVEARKTASIFAYGDFISVALNFLIVAFAMFLVVKGINKAKSLKEEPTAPAAPPTPSKEEVLLSEIRDLLKAKA